MPTLAGRGPGQTGEGRFFRRLMGAKKGRELARPCDSFVSDRDHALPTVTLQANETSGVNHGRAAKKEAGHQPGLLSLPARLRSRGISIRRANSATWRDYFFERKNFCAPVGVTLCGLDPATSVHGPITASADCKVPSNVIVTAVAPLTMVKLARVAGG